MDLLYVVQSLTGIIFLVLGWNVKTLYARLDRAEASVEKLRDDLHQEMKDVYTKHDKATDALRNEMNEMGSSLRDAINDSSKGTNALLVQILKDNK